MPNEPLDLDAIEARANAATPGPWEFVDYNDGRQDREAWLGIVRGAVEMVTERFQVARVKYSSLPRSENEANAALIAASRTDIPALIARVREQEQEIARLRSALEEQQQRAMGQLWAHDQVQHP